MNTNAFLLALTLTAVAADVSSYFPRASTHPNSVEFDSNPQYSYSYSVNDAHTGDNHAQEETRNGDNVHGSYSLVEADGTLRTVKYTADAVNGFTAVVEHTGAGSAPVSKTYGAPAGAAPLAVTAFAAPSAYASAAPSVYASPAPKATFPVRQPYSGAASVHTSFSAPHASYQY